MLAFFVLPFERKTYLLIIRDSTDTSRHVSYSLAKTLVLPTARTHEVPPKPGVAQ